MAISQPLWLLSAHGNISAYMASLSQWQYLGQYLGPYGFSLPLQYLILYGFSQPIAVSQPLWLLSAHSKLAINISAPKLWLLSANDNISAPTGGAQVTR